VLDHGEFPVRVKVPAVPVSISALTLKPDPVCTTEHFTLAGTESPGGMLPFSTPTFGRPVFTTSALAPTRLYTVAEMLQEPGTVSGS
jgi:hypothetical protein